jgi:uncharacterized protein
MERVKIAALIEWKNSPFRKPLILQGARQVGKTWLLKSFGQLHYKQLVYINFEDQSALKNMFQNDFDITRIITALEIFFQVKIAASETLIVFDEIQIAQNGITSLKYFCENAPEYHVIAAGSMLGIAHHRGSSFPVGKVDFMTLYPLTFIEFLLANGEGALANLIIQADWKMLAIFHEKLMNLLRNYFYIGGMPEVVNAYLETRDLVFLRKVQQNILNAYQNDFSKYAPIEVVPRINMVWQSIPAQLSKENKKFVYNVIKEGARAKDFELAIQWLIDCGLLLLSKRITSPKMPLAAYEEPSIFKLYMLDIGLLGAMAILPAQAVIDGNKIFAEFKGAMAEQYVRQQMNELVDYIGYWTNDRSTAEVDFLIQIKNTIIPIEVKAGENVRSRSLSEFYKKHQLPSIRFSGLPYAHNQWVENIPLYGVQTLGNK